MSMYCTLSENDSNCSSAFEGVDHLITSFQAVYAAFVILVSVPINIMFIAAFVRSRHLLDSSFALVISILVSNTITALFLSGQVFVTAVMRAWVLGYWGCQIFGFISTSATYSRWTAVGFLSLDRFCRVFFPLAYQRFEKKVLVLFLIFTWLFSILVPCILFLLDGLGFNESYPACSYSICLESTDGVDVSILVFLIMIAVLLSTVLPIILYTAMYHKARKIARTQPVLAQGDSTTENRSQTNNRNITYGLLVFTYGLIFVAYGVRYGILPYSQFSPGVIAILFYIASSLSQSTVIVDLCIIIRNRYDRKIFFDFIRKGLKKLVCDCIQDKLIKKSSTTTRVIVVSP